MPSSQLDEKHVEMSEIFLHFFESTLDEITVANSFALLGQAGESSHTNLKSWHVLEQLSYSVPKTQATLLIPKWISVILFSVGKLKL